MGSMTENIADKAINDTRIVKQFTNPVKEPIDSDINLFDLLDERAKRDPDGAMIEYKTEDGTWQPYSAQVFRDMNIGTAKPDAETLKAYPHHLIDLISPEEAYSAARFRQDALEAMADITSRGKIPLLVGGTMAALVVLGLKLIPVVNEYFGIKRALAAPGHDLATLLELEANAQSLAMGTPDHRDAVQRFLRKEPASFVWPAQP